MSKLDDFVIEEVLLSPQKTRMMLNWMIDKGLKIEPMPVTHDEMVAVIRRVNEELAARENLH